MLDRMTRIAAWLHACRVALWALTALTVAVAIVATLRGGDTDRVVLPAVVGFLWCSFLLGAAYSFVRIPRRPAPTDGFGLRLRLRAGRLLLWILLIGVLALALGLVVLSVRAVGLLL